MSLKSLTRDPQLKVPPGGLVTGIKSYTILERPVLKYGSEAWIIHKCDEPHIVPDDMKLIR